MNRPPNHNHYKVFPITKYYPKHNPHMIPTSIDQARQKDNSIPTPSTTTVPHKPSVRNTSPNLPSNSSSPRTTSLNQSTNDYFPFTSNPLDHLPTHFRSKLINSSIPTSTLQKATDHKLDTNYNNINTLSVIDSKALKRNTVLFPEIVYLLLSYKIHLILLIPLTTYTFQRTNTYLFKHYPIPYHLYIRNFHKVPHNQKLI